MNELEILSILFVTIWLVQVVHYSLGRGLSSTLQEVDASTARGVLVGAVVFSASFRPA